MPTFLKEGEIATVPPSGVVALTATTAGAVQKTTSDGVTEPVVGSAAELTAAINPATTLLPGSLSINDKGFMPKFHTTLTNATVAIAPGTLKVAAARLPAATLTANRELTLQTTDAVAGDCMWVVVQDLTAFTYIIRDGAAAGLVTHGPNATRAKAYMFFFSAGQWIFSQAWYVD